MAKTIEEMAVAYGHKHMGCCDIEDFEAGANAVLEVIEKCYDKYDPLSVIGDKVRKRIKELKG